MTDQPNDADDFPAFNEAASRADIVNFDPNRAMETGPAFGIKRSGTTDRHTFKATMLPPEDRAPIEQQLARITDPAERAAAESRLVEPVLRGYAISANVARGCPTGSAYDQEVAAITNETARLEDEAAALRAELDAVAGYEVRVNANGQPVPVPVPLYKDTERARRENRLADIPRNILALQGAEGKRRLDRAAEVELERRRAAHEELRIARVAESRAKAQLSENRINALVADKLKLLQPSGGF